MGLAKQAIAIRQIWAIAFLRYLDTQKWAGYRCLIGSLLRDYGWITISSGFIHDFMKLKALTAIYVEKKNTIENIECTLLLRCRAVNGFEV